VWNRPLSSDPNEIFPEREIRYAIDRVMHVWSLIKMVPEEQLSDARSSVLAQFFENPHLTEQELIVVGLKHLHDIDRLRGAPQSETEAHDITPERPLPPVASGRRRKVARSDAPLPLGAFSDQNILERLAQSFLNPNAG
jgi:hypothetical protein